MVNKKWPKFRFLKYLLFLLILSVSLEFGLRLTHRLDTHPERNYGFFINPFDQTIDTHYWLWMPGTEVGVNNAEFTYNYNTNSLGLCDKEIDSNDTRNMIAIVGDSFAHGQGAPQDSSMPRLLEQILRAEGNDVSVLNAGIPSGDLFFCSKLITDKLEPLGIRKFMIVMNTSDLYDFIWRGGEERFLADGTTLTRKSPWYFPVLYRYSFIFRAFFHVVLRADQSYVTRKTGLKLKQEAVHAFRNEIRELNADLKSRGGELMIILQPHPEQYSVHSAGNIFDFGYYEQLYTLLREDGLPVINLKDGFATYLKPDNYLEYSWKLDKHFNSRGYYVFARLVDEEVSEQYPEFFSFANDSTATTTLKSPLYP